jgi:tRNA nucleotidyltransferase (CCA-adding enzyme)
MMGFTFAEHFNNFLKHKGIPTKHIGRIFSNPDKSKHLETATVSALNYDLDFVNLRNETYNETSRIPDNVVS